MKQCTGCLQEKPKTEFYKNLQTADGLFYKCKECHKKAATKKKGEASKWF